MTSASRKPLRRLPPISTGTGEREVHTFRLPLDLVRFLKGEASEYQVDLTAYANLTFEGFRSYFGMPNALARQLERDRLANKMTFLEYYNHVLFRRAESIAANGAGFDGPDKPSKPKPRG